MGVINIADLPAELGARRRLIGLDPGTKTIGMAASDAAWTIASPIGTVRRQRFAADAAAVFAAMDEREAGGLVIGLPLNMDGSEGPRCQSVRAFARNLIGVRDVSILFQDERLSTMAVERAMLDADISRAKRAKAVDGAAAAYILQGVLDRLRGLAAGGAAVGPDGAGDEIGGSIAHQV